MHCQTSLVRKNHPVSAELSHPSSMRRGALAPINKMVFLKKTVRLSSFSRKRTLF
jgi:hypothetical protein